MACTITATVGSETANSYSTIEEGNTYHDTHPYPDAWSNAGTDEKCRALQTATRMLDLWFDWDGDVTDSVQALLWPRTGAVGPNGYEIPNDEIPTIIKNATAELARHLLTSDRTADSDIETQGLAQIIAGSVSLSFKSGVQAKPIPDSVMVMATQLGTARSRSGSGAIHLYRA